MIKQKLMYTTAALLLGASGVHGQFSLEVDGETAVPAGRISEIHYAPDQRAFIIRSVHQDWRCVSGQGSTPVPSPGDFRLVLDQVNPATETEAVYRVASTIEGGSITQDLISGKIIVQSSDDPAAQLTCAPFRASFSSSSFENPLSNESATPPSPFTAGGVLTVPVTVTNNSNSLVVTDVAVDFNSSTDPIGAAGVSSPSFSEPVTEPVPGTNRWTIDVLFPGESRTIQVQYDVDSQTASGTVILTESVVAGAMNRAGDAPIDVGNPSSDVSEVVVGVASGDLVAGFETNNPVAGLGSENVVLTYSITNSAGISMTSVQSSLADVTLPSGLSIGSVTSSAGSLLGNQWNIPVIAPGQTVTLEQAFTAEAATSAGVQVCGSFNIDSASEQLINTGDDAAASCAVVSREVDLRSVAPVVFPSFGATLVNAGDVFGIQLQINNDGPSNASAVDAVIELTVTPADAGVMINQSTSSSSFGTLTGGGSSIMYSVSSEIEPSGITRSADIKVDIPISTADQTSVCLDVATVSGSELDANPGNEIPPQTCITVVNTAT